MERVSVRLVTSDSLFREVEVFGGGKDVKLMNFSNFFQWEKYE